MTNAINNKSVTYFIADLHLAQNRPDITACFLSFLEKDAPNAETLYILGDLFEYWIGDDDKNPFCRRSSPRAKSIKHARYSYLLYSW